jgi:hypothetical protein
VYDFHLSIADAGFARGPQNRGMRRLGVLALAVVLAACAPAAVAPGPTNPSTPEPTASPSAATTASAEPVATAPPEPTSKPMAHVQPPKVALLPQVFAFGPLPAAAPGTADELQLTQQSLEPWTANFAEMLTRYQALYLNADAQKQIELKGAFETMVAPGPFAEILKVWALRDASEARKFAAADARILKLYAKPWGRASYADIGLKLIETGGPHDSTRDLRLRVTVGRSWRAIDAWDATTGHWLVGETPQYSGLALESEAPGAVANYLWNESYIAGGPEQFPQRPGSSRFLQARIDALNELNDAFKSRRLVDRHFEGATVKILRFDPGTYLGDGVLTVLVSGRLVEVDGSGTARETPFSQQMKFLRTVRGGFANLNAIDQQSTDGTWDSDGELALYAVDIEFG